MMVERIQYERQNALDGVRTICQTECLPAGIGYTSGLN